MAKAKITFTTCHQDFQEYGSDNESMVSRVFFTLEIGSETVNSYTEIKQVAGGKFEEEPIEVRLPPGFEGRPFNYHAFRQAVEDYYRGCFGSTGSGIRIDGGAKVRMRNCRVNKIQAVEFEVDEDARGGW